MVFGRTVHAARFESRTPSNDRYAGGLGRDPVYGDDRMSVGAASQGLSAVHDSAVLLLPTSQQRAAGHIERNPGWRMPRVVGLRGYDAGKKTKGRKWHIVTDTEGNLLALVTHTADIQDRDSAPDVIARARESVPGLAHVFAPSRRLQAIACRARDGGYAGEKLKDVLAAMAGPTIEIVKRPPGATGFVVIARRWVVERTFAWLGHCRRLAKDRDASIASADARVLVAAVRRSVRYIARQAAR